TAVYLGGPREDWNRVDRQSEVRVGGMRHLLCMLQMPFTSLPIQGDAGDVGELRREIEGKGTRDRRRSSIHAEGANDGVGEREDREAPDRGKAVSERVRAVGRLTPSGVRVDVLDNGGFLELRHQTTRREFSANVEAFDWGQVRDGQ